MKRFNKALLTPIAIVIAFFAITLSSLGTILGVFSAAEIVKLAEKDFTYNYHGHAFNCYFVDSSNLDEGVAIGWGDNTNTPLGNDETLEVPDEVTYNNHSYDVVSVATAGFRNCKMKSIQLPSSITSFSSEAFAYCIELTTITIPYNVQVIPSSAFLDCKKLQSVYYGREDSDEITTKNYAITRIEDHAFDSCIKLASFNCPRNAVFFGKSCFQNCTSLKKFSFPTKETVSTNSIVIKDYAFHNCSKLRRIYCEDNISYISNYAFADCDSGLVINYTGNAASLTGRVDTYWRQRYIAKNRNNSSDADGVAGNLIKINYNVSPVRGDPNYPGLLYSIHTESQLLNCGVEGETDIVIVQSNSKKYAIIEGINPPDDATDYADIDDDIDEYYDIDTKALTIPEYVVDTTPGSLEGTIPVKVIGAQAFQESSLTSVTFNSNLIQICNNAFASSADLVTVDFSACTALREISYQAFKSCEKIERVSLPYTLEYIGAQAFQSCKKISYLTFYGNNRLLIKGSSGWSDVEGTVLSGMTSPSNSDGANGNYYIDLMKNKAYLKSGGAWSELQNVLSGITDPAADLGSTGNYYITCSRLKVICERAFDIAGNVGGTVNLVLPETLNDQDAAAAHLIHFDTQSLVDNFREVAVQRYAFCNCRFVGSVQMADATTAHKNLSNANQLTYTCSFGAYAFSNCTNLFRFQTSDNFYTIGACCFYATTNKFKELFLHSKKAGLNSSPYNYPFAIGETTDSNSVGDSLFLGGSPRSELVIYVKGSSPKKIDNGSTYTGSVTERWNTERVASFPNYFIYAGSDTATTRTLRSHVPTYYNVDWDEDNSILYWRPTPSENQSEFISRPKFASEFETGTGFIALIEDPSNAGDYIVTKYYAKVSNIGLKTCIDLSSIPANNFSGLGLSLSANDISSNLTTIGISAFGTSDGNRDNSKTKGNYFILPETVERIEERAFYRQAPDTYNYGVRVVTYRNDSDAIVGPNGVAYANDAAFTTYINSTASSGGDNDDTAKARKGFCYLSDTVEYIGNDCFYGHIFETIRLGSGITHIGTNAFNYLAVEDSGFHQNTSISVSNQASNLVVGTSGGLYYTYDTNKKFLIYQPPVHTSGTELTLDTGTSAVGRYAVTDTDYTKITIPSSVQTLYGGAFQNNTSLTEVANASGLKYINAFESISTSNGTVSYQTEWNNTMPFDIFDYIDYLKTDSLTPYEVAMSGAFKNCTSLSTINFKSMSGLVSIGDYAFAGCPNLEHLAGSNQYSYYYYNNSHQISAVANSTGISSGVLDLTPSNPLSLSPLRRIGLEAFIDINKNDNKIKYIHLPRTAEPEQYSQLTVGVTGNDKRVFPSGKNLTILTGETVEQVNYDFDWNGSRTHYLGSWYGGGNNIVYYYVGSAYLVRNLGGATPSGDSAPSGTYLVDDSTNPATVWVKVGNAWRDVRTEEGCRVFNGNKNNSPYKTVANYINDYVFNTNGKLLYKALSGTSQGNAWRGVGDLPTTETYQNNYTYGAAKYNYWTYDEDGNVILFKKGDSVNSQQLAREFFFYGIVS